MNVMSLIKYGQNTFLEKCQLNYKMKLLNPSMAKDGGDIYAFAEDYFRLVGDLWERARCRIIGHFDLLTKFNEDGSLLDETHPRYLRAAGEALDRLMEAPVLFEVNTGAMARGYRTTPYPGPVLRREIARRGGTFIRSSDCHRKDQLLYGLADLPQPGEVFADQP